MRENWRRQGNKELMQLFGDLDVLSFGRISWLNWIGHVNRMTVKRIEYITIILREETKRMTKKQMVLCTNRY